ncbi:MAG: hypothetical protein EOO13_05110 [Chitinophagaceae bacterium]|nr:MAG: hypothetical protein EOO13_05110 [Chitinophagaceae bacterium]
MRIFLSIALLLSGQIMAQTPDRGDYSIWQNGTDSNYHVFSNKAMIRQSPSSDALLLDSLLLGEKVKGKEITKTFSTIRSIYAPWLKVDYQKNGQTKSGYIWMGLLGFQSLVKGDTAFIYGLEKVKSGRMEPTFEQIKFTIVLKAITNNQLLATKEWTIDGGESTSYVASKMLGNVGLKNIHEVLRINLGGEACGIPTNYYYHGWNGSKFYDLPGKYEVGDAGVFYHTETLLFPSERGGKAGHVIRLIEEEELIQEETATQKEKFKKTNKKELYAWNGERATKLK